MIAATVVQEDVDVVGISLHNGGHLTLVPDVIAALRSQGLDTPVVIGGIIPDRDLPALAEAGVVAVLGPGASEQEVLAAIRRAAQQPH